MSKIWTTNINFKKISDNALVPTYGTDFAAGADLYACTDEPIRILAGQTICIKTGVAVEIPEGLVGLIFARSGLASKEDLAPANKVGVIDSDYRGEIMVMLHNHGQKNRVIENGERIAQMVFMPYVRGIFNEVQELSDTIRGEGGFGSTGK